MDDASYLFITCDYLPLHVKQLSNCETCCGPMNLHPSLSTVILWYLSDCWSVAYSTSQIVNTAVNNYEEGGGTFGYNGAEDRLHVVHFETNNVAYTTDCMKEVKYFDHAIFAF